VATPGNESNVSEPPMFVDDSVARDRESLARALAHAFRREEWLEDTTGDLGVPGLLSRDADLYLIQKPSTSRSGGASSTP
jgi:hypothetical protein